MNKKITTLSVILLIMFSLCGCTDTQQSTDAIAPQNEIYLSHATITHSTPDSTSYSFDFNYIYNGKDVFDSDLLQIIITYIDTAGNKQSRSAGERINGISHSYTERVYITPYASISINVYFEGNDRDFVKITECQSITVTYNRMSEIDKNQVQKTLRSKTFKVVDLIRQATDIPYTRW